MTASPMIGRWVLVHSGTHGPQTLALVPGEYGARPDQLADEEWQMPVVPCDDAAVERVATKLAEIMGYHVGPLEIDRRSARALLRAAAEAA